MGRRHQAAVEADRALRGALGSPDSPKLGSRGRAVSSHRAEASSEKVQHTPGRVASGLGTSFLPQRE